MVLLPPYLKDRRVSGRTFSPGHSSGVNSAQRFLPLQQASSRYATSSVSSPTGMRTTGGSPIGMRTSGVSALGSGTIAHSSLGSPQPSLVGAPAGSPLGNRAGSHIGNVVQLRPVDAEPELRPENGSPDSRAPLATSAAAYLEDAPAHDESILGQAWDTAGSPGLGMPHSTVAARERRRQVLLGLTGVALVTLLLALFAGGRWVAVHVFVDVVMVGYVILLVRHRQLMADRRTKVEPIRPPVSEQSPASMQLAPSYLLNSKTGS